LFSLAKARRRKVNAKNTEEELLVRVEAKNALILVFFARPLRLGGFARNLKDK
jgi:hypothetical protein